MNDAVAMDVVKRRRDLHRDVVKRVPIFSVEEFRDALARKKLHREVRERVVKETVVVDSDDVRMLERRERRELRFES